MTTSLAQVQNESSIRLQAENMIADLIASLPNPEHLSSEERRGIIARYTSVLEGNFIYWMTAAYLSTQSEEARPIILENLHEEVRDCHPAMMRRFAIAAHSYPATDDFLAVNEELGNVRIFLGRLNGVQNLLTMAFFEGFIQQFMSFLADLAVAEGSSELEYTDVHGICDIAHSQGLFIALSAEMALNPPEPGTDIFEGVHKLCGLIRQIVRYPHGKQIHACS